jgi:hypothetical protein
MSHEEKETYRGDVASYEGKVPLWLKIVFSALIIWAIVYFIKYWGGFGPAYNP